MSWNVESVMTRDVVTVPPEAPYKEIAECLHENRVTAVPVVDADSHVMGMVSEADMLLKEERRGGVVRGHLLDRGREESRAEAITAVAVMTSPPVTIGPEATLSEAARIMHRRRVKRLPVVAPDGRLIGIVSRSDLLRAFLRADDEIANEVRNDVIVRDLMIDPDSIEVTAHNGIVRLEGEVETRSLARILVRLVRGVEGVVSVDDRLRWKLDDTGLQPDLAPLALRLAADERE